MAPDINGCVPNSISRQPTTLMALDTSITRPLGNDQRTPPQRRQHHVEEGEQEPAPPVAILGPSYRSNSTAATNSVIGQRAENCAAMIV